MVGNDVPKWIISTIGMNNFITCFPFGYGCSMLEWGTKDQPDSWTRPGPPEGILDETITWCEDPNDPERVCGSFLAGWMLADAYLYYIPATDPRPGFKVAAVLQQARDLTSTQLYVTICAWNDPSYDNVPKQRQLIASGKGYSDPTGGGYGWGFSEVWMDLVPG